MPGPDVPQISWLDKIYFDKWVHAGLFGGMAFFFSLPFIYTNRSTKKLLIYIAILSLLYGVIMEYCQKYIAYERDFDVNDMIADGVGAVIGYFVSIFFRNMNAKKQEKLI